MDAILQIYQPDSKEYKRLKAAAILIEAETGVHATVEETYFDYGSNWKYSSLSIPCRFMSASYQTTDPKQYKALVSGTLEEYAKVLSEIIESVKKDVT